MAMPPGDDHHEGEERRPQRAPPGGAPDDRPPAETPRGASSAGTSNGEPAASAPAREPAVASPAGLPKRSVVHDIGEGRPVWKTPPVRFAITVAVAAILEFNAEMERERALRAGHPAGEEPYVEPRDTRKW